MHHNLSFQPAISSATMYKHSHTHNFADGRMHATRFDKPRSIAQKPRAERALCEHYSPRLTHRPKPCTWTPRVCKAMAFRAILKGFGPLLYILSGSKYCFRTAPSPARCKADNTISLPEATRTRLQKARFGRPGLLERKRKRPRLRFGVTCNRSAYAGPRLPFG